MPTYTVTGSTDNFARLIAAIEDRREDLVGEDGTDRELYIAWLKGVHTEPIFKHERKTAMGTVAPDAGIVDVT